MDGLGRFRSSRRVAAHFGLTPKKHQFGEMAITGGINKAGAGMVRSMLYEAALVILIRKRAQPGDDCRCAGSGHRAPSHEARRNDIPLRKGDARAA
ncbi:transposase [Palleronia marisminoris]|uniref:transposase n=1 Tax=Palleronia marisminoris TaxID=315423 RepID=UPI001587A7C6